MCTWFVCVCVCVFVGDRGIVLNSRFTHQLSLSEHFKLVFVCQMSSYFQICKSFKKIFIDSGSFQLSLLAYMYMYEI